MTDDKLTKIMGKEYAESYEGKLFYALEKVYLEAIKGRSKIVCHKIANLIKYEDRQRLSYSRITYSPSGEAIRWGKDSPWEDVPLFTRPKINEVSTLIMWTAPNSGQEFLQLWQDNPQKVAWLLIDSVKLIEVVHQTRGLLHG